MPDIIAHRWGNIFYHPDCTDVRRMSRRCYACGYTHENPLVNPTTGRSLRTCDNCGQEGRVYWKSVERGTEMLYQPVCQGCGADIEGTVLRSYIPNYNRRFRYHFNSLRTYGVEIECVINSDSSRDAISNTMRDAGLRVLDISRYNHSDAATDQWIMKYDGSIRGGNGRSIDSWQALEIVTPVLQGEDDMRQIQLVCDILADRCTTNRSCGIHVHHGAVDFSPVDLVKLYQLCYTDQNIVRSLLPDHRRNNQYCAPLRLLHNPNRLAVVNNWGSMGPNVGRVADSLAAHVGRASVNFCSFAIRGTIEFRSYHSTFDYTQIRNWIYLTQALMEKARSTISSHYRVYRNAAAGSSAAMAFLLHERLGFPMNPSSTEGMVASELKARREEIMRGATA